MNLEKYTERARGFVQSAQSLAVREGHQQFTPENILKVLLDDPVGGQPFGKPADRGHPAHRRPRFAKGAGQARNALCLMMPSRCSVMF